MNGKIVVFLSSFCLLFTIKTSGKDSGFLKSSVLFCRPIHAIAHLESKMVADIIYRNIEAYVSENTFNWQSLPYPIDTAFSNALLSIRDGDTIKQLPDPLFLKIKSFGHQYLVLIYHVKGIIDNDEDGRIFFPIYGGVSVVNSREIDGPSDSEYDQFDFTYSIISLDSNRTIYTNRLSTTLCSDNAYSCLATVLFDDISNINAENKKVNTATTLDSASKSSFSNAYNTGTALFAVGSCMTFSGFAVAVAGTSEAAKTVGTTLFIVGESGLLLCGISNVMMNAALKKYTGNPTSGGSAGWIFQGGSLLSMGAGIGLIISALTTDLEDLVIPGLILVESGVVLSPLSWVFYLKHRRKMLKIFKRVTIQPHLSYNLNKSTTLNFLVNF